MNSEDNFKVWETKAMKRAGAGAGAGAGEGEAKKILERIAKQVQPIMRKHKWRVKLLSEMHTTNLLGLNVGAGVHVKLQLRNPKRDWEFLPFDHVLDTMLHELCHNAIAPHDARFYKLWDELRKECDELRSKGITGVQGFDLPGRRLGGISPQPPLSSLRQTAQAAAEKRAHLKSLLPSGPQRLGGIRLLGPKCLGGNRSIMVDLSPVQAAAMAAERRLQDDLWCASLSSGIGESSSDISKDLLDMGLSTGNLKISSGQSTNASDTISRKRSRESNISLESNFVDLDADTSTSEPILNHDTRTLKSCKSSQTSVSQSDCHSGSGFVGTSCASSPSMRNYDATPSPEEPAMWECKACTFLNHPLIPICEVCNTPRPKDASTKNKIWTCKFCTLENSLKLDKCSACEQWRFSQGQPVSTRTPYVGT